MDAKDKALELVKKFLPHVYCYMGSGMLSNDYDESVALDNAKDCATKAVDEVLRTLWRIGEHGTKIPPLHEAFYDLVKTRIQEIDSYPTKTSNVASITPIEPIKTQEEGMRYFYFSAAFRVNVRYLAQCYGHRSPTFPTKTQLRQVVTDADPCARDIVILSLSEMSKQDLQDLMADGKEIFPD